MRKLVLTLCVFLMVVGAGLVPNYSVNTAEDELPDITTSSVRNWK